MKTKSIAYFAQATTPASRPYREVSYRRLLQILGRILLLSLLLGYFATTLTAT